MTDVDVLVVGQGVVGQFASLLLARHGHRVLAVERHAQPYALPRAVHYDPDVNRMLAGLGIGAEEQATFSEPAASYDWLNADGRLLLSFPAPLDGEQGWPESTMFSQADLEASLRRQQGRIPTLETRWGTSLTAISQDGDRVTATLVGPDGTAEVRASYVIGCDGANSTVRDLVGIQIQDLDFSSDWLVMDLKMPPRVWTPENGQICDPKRPRSSVSGGPGRRRFEFMLMPGEDAATFSTEENAWRLVEPWGVDPAHAELERLAMYTFHAHCATTWHVGRVFIAGDAAHRMPPFFGRGMVSGARDAMNLTWKIDLVMRGLADEHLLDTYSTERHAHVQYALGMSIELGRVICETDPEKVAARDAHLLARGPLPWNALPPMPPEMLGPGFFPGGEAGADPVAARGGQQHPLLGPDDRVALLDEVAFAEFTILVDRRRLSAEDAAAIRSATPAGLPAKIIEVEPVDAQRPTVHSGVDVTGRYGALFDAIDRAVIVYRPDFHGYGSAVSLDEALTLVGGLSASGSLQKG
ncbi:MULTISPECIES: bifunctional 3-(3-hydroxy-phenyl)propionate/3-hydroxycinnamic acid hydroxylase [unclassified Microbacterium]|uniref:bifunctional 3-(3-hydroxy-phenyl)propionate/3-hydroxycinnamic acid hydroxylase n=1 Tax=unclassified Microbacterium TaxID=2609290 RepID=UPI00214B2D48|nr:MULTISPECIES: bifunctional 3-(3-hydroxy-phenyl)propionate/3-hydroxycinnamic acid hydroxylase [unclassified Microbacterium]MCR2783294.1 bifunctional 3-(3-hydroxy-phenyl)propionate/3-hydroxycinnamic acid hydroxylase [Microbacterium sp. zg.B96]WIM15831.1 bifunctional 3-(3-hydroxy-phenyl)propionate/3-hydroxycinnamic acid hydroxylase [Microbacterium sp. zg-B96]